MALFSVKQKQKNKGTVPLFNLCTCGMITMIVFLSTFADGQCPYPATSRVGDTTYASRAACSDFCHEMDGVVLPGAYIYGAVGHYAGTDYWAQNNRRERYYNPFCQHYHGRYVCCSRRQFQDDIYFYNLNAEGNGPMEGENHVEHFTGEWCTENCA